MKHPLYTAAKSFLDASIIFFKSPDEILTQIAVLFPDRLHLLSIYLDSLFIYLEKLIHHLMAALLVRVQYLTDCALFMFKLVREALYGPRRKILNSKCIRMFCFTYLACMK